MTGAAILVGLAFLLTYIFIALDRVPRMLVALMGALFVVIFRFITFDDAIKSIDFNTIGLLMGMMILVSIARRSGLFEYLSIKIIKAGKGNMWYIVMSLAGLTGLLSSMLDNVTTVLLIVPLTISLADELAIEPIPLLIIEVIASNIGGTATLVGDPPNIMIGSAAGLGYLDFLTNLAPVAIIIFIVVIPLCWYFYRKNITPSPEGLAVTQRTHFFNHRNHGSNKGYIVYKG